MLSTPPSENGQLSSMSLSGRLITLAKDADDAGYAHTSGQLVRLALTVFDETPRRAGRTHQHPIEIIESNGGHNRD
jgi:hypothetical protein